MKMYVIENIYTAITVYESDNIIDTIKKVFYYGPDYCYKEGYKNFDGDMVYLNRTTYNDLKETCWPYELKKLTPEDIALAIITSRPSDGIKFRSDYFIYDFYYLEKNGSFFYTPYSIISDGCITKRVIDRTGFVNRWHFHRTFENVDNSDFMGMCFDIACEFKHDLNARYGRKWNEEN